jgi:hypothetical protein
VASYQKAFENEGSDRNFGYCLILRSDPWEELINYPFDEDKMKAYLHHTALEYKKEQVTQFSLRYIFWESYNWCRNHQATKVVLRCETL